MMMEPGLIALAAASIAFVGSHFIMSHPFRRPMVAILGEKGFLGVYSLVSLAAFAWMVMAFRAAPSGDGGGYGTSGWIAASVLTLLALVLFLGSLKSNPALPDPDHAARFPAEARGVFRVTRHPMMWGFALWAIAHIILFWSTRTLILASGMLVLALLGAHLQDRKKLKLLGEKWADWEAETFFWPRFSQIFCAGRTVWLAAIAVWLGASWLHLWLAGIPAGIWRWWG
jgi:uncharacterized membrane protein